MDGDITKRDGVRRAYIGGKDWDENPEFGLVRSLVTGDEPLLAPFPYLYDYEWEVSPGRTDQGRGDLVFTDGEGRFAVVEVKYVDLGRTGHTARVKRRKSRRIVVEQARQYATVLALHSGGGAVVAFTMTNEDGLCSAEGGYDDLQYEADPDDSE